MEVNESTSELSCAGTGAVAKPLVTICINNYNYAPFLRTAIDSALNQTYSPIEVIVVDDGSTDDSVEILRSYGNAISTLLQANGGQSAAVNAGFTRSRGDVVIFLDSDDVLESTAVESVVNDWQPTTAKVQFPLQSISESGDPLAMLVPRLPLDSGNVVPRLLKSGHYVTPPMSGNAYSRTALASIMPIPEQWVKTRQPPDAYISHLIPFFGRVESISETRGFYRIHRRNRSLQVNEQKDGLVRKLKVYLTTELMVRSSIQQVASRQGLQLSELAVVGNYSCLKAHLSLVKLGGHLEDLPSWSVGKISWNLLRDVWRSPTLASFDRYFLLGWTVLTAISTGHAAETLVAVGISPMARPAWMQKLVRLLSPKKK